MKSKLLIVASLIATTAAVACGSALDSTSGFDANPNNGGGGGTGDANGEGGSPQTGTGTDGGAPIASAGSVVLVHASRNLPAFRVCFSDRTFTLPLPDDKIMPNANVVGVDVGTAVHIGQIADNLKGNSNPDASVAAYDAGEGGVDAGGPVSGQLAVIEEKLARQFYPQGTDPSTWPACGALVNVLRENGYEGHGLYTLTGDTVTPNDSSAIFVVVKGCLPDPKLTTKECGTGFTTTRGNLSYETLQVLAQDGTGFDFEAVSATPAVPDGSALFFYPNNDPTSSTAALAVTSSTVSSVVSSSLPTNDMGYTTASFELRTVSNTQLLQQPLSDIQARSSPRDLPASFFGLRSTFVIFAIGDPALQKTDPASLHFLAVPVRDPDQIDPEGGAL